MKIEQYMADIRNGKIPPEPPEGLSPGGMSWLLVGDFGQYTQYVMARQECTRSGLWIVIDQIWTRVLADWIGDRAVLEIMAGAGFLAKALAEHGINILATDDFSWFDMHTTMELVFDIQKMEAAQAVKTIKADILLVSWPPYGDDAIIEVCRHWGAGRPIIYIGENDGGCNAPEEFFEHFHIIDDCPEIPMVSWYGVHDFVFIGHWK